MRLTRTSLSISNLYSPSEAEAGELFDLYGHSRPLTPSSIKGEEGSDEVVSELDENNETNKMSPEKRARLSNSTIQGGTAFTAIEEKGISTEQEYSSKATQVRLQSKTKWYSRRRVREFSQDESSEDKTRPDGK